MPVTLLRGRRAVLAVIACAPVAGLATSLSAQAMPPPPTVEATSQIAGAIPSQTMDSGMLPAGVGVQAAVNDSFSGPIQIGGMAIGSATVSVNASSAEGTFRLFSQTSDSSSLATVAVLTNLEAKASDSVQITQLPGGQGQLSAVYFPSMLSAAGMVTGAGTQWSATIRLNATINDFASDGTLRASYSLAADYSNGNIGPVSHDSGPVTIPVQLNDTLSMSVDETLQTSASAARGEATNVTADFSHGTRIYLVPMSPGLAFTSASGHDYLPLAGDVNVDGKVDFSDLLSLAQNYGSNGVAWMQGDFNADGMVDFGDLLALAQHYGQMVNATTAAGGEVGSASANVPEPSSAAPVAAGALGLLCRKRQT